MLSTVKETVTEKMTAVTGTVASATASAVESTIKAVEGYDKEAATRPKHFGASEGEAKQADKALKNEESKGGAVAKMEEGAGDNFDASLKRLKMVTGDLLDLWLFEGSKGLNYLKESKAYKLTDPYVHYVDQFETVKTKGVQIAETLEEKKTQVTEKLGDLQ